jgi:hypothetical protein
VRGVPWPFSVTHDSKYYVVRDVEIYPSPKADLLIAEEAGRRYMESGLVVHRKSLACTGRDLTKQVLTNLVGSPELIFEKDRLPEKDRRRPCLRALMIPADSMAEFEDQVEWFAKVAL